MVVSRYKKTKGKRVIGHLGKDKQNKHPPTSTPVMNLIVATPNTLDKATQLTQCRHSSERSATCGKLASRYLVMARIRIGCANTNHRKLATKCRYVRLPGSQDNRLTNTYLPDTATL